MAGPQVRRQDARRADHGAEPTVEGRERRDAEDVLRLVVQARRAGDGTLLGGRCRQTLRLVRPRRQGTHGQRRQHAGTPPNVISSY